jgi:RimJ/RimL family protein N-acetyltransferase
MWIETKRLIIRQLTHQDLDALYDYAKRDMIGPLAGWRPHQNKSESKLVLEWMIDSKEVYAIAPKETNQLIGTIGLHVRKKEHELLHVRELGYALSNDYWGVGIMPEAVKAILTYGFETMHLKKIIVGHISNNIQSKRVIEKCGFIPTHHEYRDHLGEQKIVQMYAIERNIYGKDISI